MPLPFVSRYGEHGPVVFSLCAMSLIINVGFGVIMPFLPLFAQSMGADAVAIGFITSAFMVGRTASGFLVGQVSDRRGRKPVILVGLVVFGASTAAMAVAPTWGWILVLRLVQGAAAGATWPIAEALLVDSVPARLRGEVMGLYISTLNAGMFVGPALAGLIFLLVGGAFGTSVGYASAFLLTGALAFASALLGRLYVREVYVGTRLQREDAARLEADYRKVRGSVLAFYVVELVNGVGIGLIIPIFALYFVDVLGQSPELLAFIMSIGGLVNILFSTPIGMLSDRIGRKRLIYIGMLVAVVATFLWGFVPVALGIAALFILRSFSFALFFPPYRALQADLIPGPVRGKLMGQMQSWWNLGAVLGPIVGGSIYVAYQDQTFSVGGLAYEGAALPFAFTATFTAVGMLLMTRVRERPQARTDVQTASSGDDQ